VARRRRRLRTVTALLASAALSISSLVIAGSAQALAPPTITSITPHFLAEGIGEQLITVAGTNFDQIDITAVALDHTCTAPQYMVVSSTLMYLLTVGTTCVADATPAIITLTSTAAAGPVTSPALADSPAPSAALLAATRLIFSPAPALRGTKPIVTDATADLAVSADQVESGAINGGTKVRVYSDSGTTQWVSGVTAKLGGVAMTSVAIPVSTAATATAPAIVNPAAQGNYFTAIVPAMPAASNLSLEVTMSGVTVPLATTFDIAGQTITVAPAFGPASGLTPITITGKFGAGFATTAVTMCGEAATYVSGTATAVKFLTPPILTTTASAKPCNVLVAAGADPVASPVSLVSSGSVFTYNAN